MLLCKFLFRSWTTTTWNDQMLSWLKDGNGKAISFNLSLSLSVWTRTRSPLFSSNLISLLSRNWMTWYDREKVSTDAASPLSDSKEFKIPRQRRPRKRRLKSEFAFFHSLSWLLQLIYFVKCKRTLFEPNSKELYSSSDRERKFSRRLFTSHTKREMRHFPVVVVQWWQRNVQKKRDARAELSFAYSTNCFFDALVVVAVVAS